MNSAPVPQYVVLGYRDAEGKDWFLNHAGAYTDRLDSAGVFRPRRGHFEHVLSRGLLGVPFARPAVLTAAGPLIVEGARP